MTNCCACQAKWRWRSPKCCSCHENATHLSKTTQKYCACHTKCLSARLQTRENVRKCYACHANQHYNQLWYFLKGEILHLPPIDTVMPQENQRIETRHVGASKRGFRPTRPQVFTLCSLKIDVFLRVFLGTSKFCNLKINVSCEASVNFQHISQNATPVAEFAPCRHLTQPCQCDVQKTRNTTRLKCCACHEKWRWTRPKRCACHILWHIGTSVINIYVLCWVGQ